MSRSTHPSTVAPRSPTAPASQETALESVLQQLRVRGKRRPLSMAGANFESALEALWANRMRSLLTVLGIFIGVAAVIAALTLTQGANAYIQDKLASLSTMVIVYPGASRSAGASQGIGTSSTLTDQDAASVAHLPHVANSSPFIVTNDQVVYGNQNWTTQIEGVDSDVLTMQNWTLAQGSWFSSADESQGAPVAVLGDTVYHNLFDASGDNPIGKQVRIRNTIFRVIGVLAAQGGGFTQDDVVLVPFKAAQIRLRNTNTIDQIQIAADTKSNVPVVDDEVTKVLQKNHHITNPTNDDFTVFTFTNILQQIQQSDTVLEALMVGIAAISLTVGGIGIMNIMLVSVTERTWEIGIRMSIGARRRDIRNQFLIEALVLCLIGGIIGLFLGLLIGKVVTNLAALPFVITPTTIIVPFAVASGIAMIFGIYPAVRASHLDPIVAIRSEE
jgi:putative ABC transport system permease protein